MTIISAIQNNSAVSPEQIQKDMPELVRLHEDALKQEPLWEFFGGVITIDSRVYQVA